MTREATVMVNGKLITAFVGSRSSSHARELALHVQIALNAANAPACVIVIAYDAHETIINWSPDPTVPAGKAISQQK